MYFSGPTLRIHRYVASPRRRLWRVCFSSVLLPLARTQVRVAHVLTCEFEALEVIAQLMSTPAFLAAAVVLGLAGAFALIKHRSKKTIPRLPDAKLD